MTDFVFALFLLLGHQYLVVSILIEYDANHCGRRLTSLFIWFHLRVILVVVRVIFLIVLLLGTLVFACVHEL